MSTRDQDDAYDVIVLGAGAGAKMVWSALPGQRVAVVEDRLVGGACPFVACIPSKAMLRTAAVWELAHDPEHEDLFTGRVPAAEAYRVACDRRDRIVQHRDDTANAQALASTATLVRGRGRVTSPGVVDVEGRQIRYRELVLNTGSSPVLPPIPGLDQVQVWTSDVALSTTHLPARILVLGGGAVGCELAFVFATFGSQVTLVQRRPKLLPAEEPEVSRTVGEALERRGVEVKVDCEVERVRPDGSGLVATLSNGETARADLVLLAAGRRPSTEGLGLETLGVAPQPDGSLTVDATCAVVGAEHLWAIGDVTGISPFTHTAHYQGRVVAANLRGLEWRADYRSVPRAVYLQPSMAAVGHTRASARAVGIKPLVATDRLGSTVKARTHGAGEGWLTLLADPATGHLIGATAMGGDAEEWISMVSLAIRADVPIDAVADIVHPFPTFGELLEGPLWDLAGQLAERRRAS
jgi:pyruvate/2-oxoglutarate dehydrogenase complex dihydrolipoamide dehydrogenase (E3) component